MSHIVTVPRINIPELFNNVVTKVKRSLDRDVYFDYGKLREVSRKLTQKDLGVTTGNKKYPLIWLVMNYAETYGNSDFCTLEDITIMFCMLTEPQLTTQQRIAKNFIPTLYPIYDEFLVQIDESGYFDNTGLSGYEHQKIDCPFWNEDMLKGDYNQFNDYIDAIQLRKLKLSVNESVCNRFKLLN